MKILAIETSCDDTCAAVVEDNRTLSNVISSQIKIHQEWGGVVPNLAKRAHQERIDPVIKRALQRARIKIDEIELVAVTYGPGLSIALGVGIEKAKTLGKKLVAVNHIEGHLMSNFVKNSRGKPERKIEFPALGLTASGGHSLIVLMEGIGKYKVVGQTLDDAAGEALDKAAKMLGLGYPGGPVIERVSQKGKDDYLELPRPMKNSKGFDYSFSGLKTSFYYQVRDWPKKKIKSNLANLAASFQRAVFETLLIKYQQAIEAYHPKTLLGSGGVMSNLTLRRMARGLAKEYDIPIYFPPKKELNTDNAAMIGVAGYYKALRGEFCKPEKLDREPRARL